MVVRVRRLEGVEQSVSNENSCLKEEFDQLQMALIRL